MADAIGTACPMPSQSRKRKPVAQTTNNIPAKKTNKNSTVPASISIQNPVPGNSKQKQQVTNPVKTNNMFNILENNENEVIVQRKNVEKKTHIPPIVVKENKALTLYSAMELLNITLNLRLLVYMSTVKPLKISRKLV